MAPVKQHPKPTPSKARAGGTAPGRRASGQGSNPTRRKDGRLQQNWAWTDSQGVLQKATIYGRSLAELSEKAKAIQERIHGKRPARDSTATLGGWYVEWVEKYLEPSERAETTKDSMQQVARGQILKRPISGKVMARLVPSDFNVWKSQMRADGMAPGTQRYAWTILKAILDGAVSDRLIPANPMEGLERPKVPKAKARYLEPGDLGNLIRWCYLEEPHWALAFHLMALTGLRRGEALGLQWSDVQETAQGPALVISHSLGRTTKEGLRLGQVKGDKPRPIPLSPEVMGLLAKARTRRNEYRLKAGDLWQTDHPELIFPSELGGFAEPRNVLRDIQDVAKRHGLEGVKIHTLRHSAASIMLMDPDTALLTVSEILGHSSVTITGDIYGHVHSKAATTAMANLGKVIG